jgi:hypothetical protein
MRIKIKMKREAEGCGLQAGREALTDGGGELS